MNANKPVEGILVCTGVYNPQNDYLFQLRSLFEQSVHMEGDTNLTESNRDDEDNKSCSSLSVFMPSMSTHKSSSSTSVLLRDPNAAAELREALSRRNSFINYFENKLNMPDLTVPNLLDAVNYILNSLRR